MEIRAIKLKTGEDILGRMQVGTDGILVKMPIIFGLNNQNAISFFPYLIGIADDQIVNIKFDGILVEPYKVLKNLEDAYIKQTTSIDLSTTIK